MVKRCVVQFCTDSNKTGHTMQIYPNEAKHLFSHLMKDYGEASCSGASAEPVKDTDMSEPLPEFETRIKEREFVDISV